LLWIKRNLPDVWRGVEAGITAVGTVESYLVARISGGRSHITDASNASRTQLYNLHEGNWDDSLLALFEVPRAALPQVVANYGPLAMSFAPAFLGLEIAITGLAGDQQAALFGQGAIAAGDAKCTFGTGAFLLLNTGETVVQSKSGLLATVAWQHPSGARTYALEGSVFVAGAAVQWLRDGLQIIDDAAEIEALASQVEDSNGVSFVPALTGLGAPFWRPDATGSLHGITRGTTRAHIARATLEGIAWQVYHVFESMSADAALRLERLRVDGGAAANNLLMQIQSDQLQCQIERAEVLESTAFGAALFAGLGAGIFTSLDLVSDLNRVRSRFNPGSFDEVGRDRWLNALQRENPS
jgi:glycerol kinase